MIRSRPGGVRAVLFDLDETLIHHRRSDAEAFAAVAAAAGIGKEALPAAVGEAAMALWRSGPAFPYCQRIGISWSEGLAGPFGPSPEADLQVLHDWIPTYRERAWGAALAALGRPEARLARRAAEAFRDARLAHIMCYDDAASTLEILSGRFRLALVTNGAPDFQALKLERSGLRRFFDAVLISGAVGYGKPDPRIFQMAREQLGGVEPAEVLMVGDNPTRDVAGAHAAGIFAVLVDRSEPPESGRSVAVGPDATVGSLAELGAWLG